MKIYVPDYYSNFSCIADKCKHSCCIGWEIDIDDITMEKYKEIKDITDNIVTDGNGVNSFKLCEGERCPFLNERGLCRLILKYGEDILCDICAEHPRYRNFYSDRTEMGLGLCCEAAAELIVGNEQKTSLVLLSDDGCEDIPDDYEADLLEAKRLITKALQNREISYHDREKTLLPSLKDYSRREIYDILYPLERLSPEWDGMLSALMTEGETDILGYDTVKEQLAVYFIFRHLNGECYDIDEAVYFSLFSVRAITCIARAYYGKAPAISEIADIARMYSAEIEYSDCNTEEIVEKISVG
ncbi:MAG: flagellin lysine-N-methylase [Ruminiclostridium sp.]|nr:flagellin lysine-N-methylase [Ruminiclostridium sp.]